MRGYLCNSKQRKNGNPAEKPPLSDAALMMVQTEWLSTDGTGWEISPIIEHQNAAKQTVRRPQKSEEKAPKPSGFKAFPVAGAEGLEPSARGFGDRCSTN